jgi:hypothetical protein
MAFSGADATPFDQQNGANAPIDSKPGAITPTGADYLFISATALESASTPFETINPIFTSESVPLVSSTSYGLGCGYYIQSGGPTAVNPEWDHGLAVPMTLITYQPSAGGGGGATCAGRLTLLGVGGC